jgi:hypothetical protein
VPEYAVEPGEVLRLRILDATNSPPLFLALPGFTAWQIGFDGVNTLAPLPVDMSGAGVTTITPVLTGRGFTIDGVLYQEMVCATRPRVGTFAIPQKLDGVSVA